MPNFEALVEHLSPLAEQFDFIDPKKLVDYDKNAKKHPKEQLEKLARSFKEEGFHGVIVVDENRVIIAGHGRKHAAIKAGLKTVPIQILRGLTEDQKRSKRLGDNKLAESDWLDDILKSELSILNDANYDLSLAGFDTSFLNDLNEENTNDPDDCPEPSDVQIRCALGDTWQLGNHTLYVGDSTDEANVFLLMQDTKADLIVTDPPYNVDYEEKNEYLKKYRPSSRKKSDIQNDKMTDGDFSTFLNKVYANYNTISKQGAAIYVFFPSSETLNFINGMVDSGWLFKQMLVWKKNHIVLGRQDYQWIHEPILYGWKEGAAHHWYSDRKQTTVLEFDKPARSGEHPTMKPIDILEYLISNSSKQKDVVVDLFGGSGSTLIACEKTKRICKTMELDPKYASVIVERWEKYTGKEAVKLGI